VSRTANEIIRFLKRIVTMQNPDYAVPALYINGEWITETARKGEVWNPATEEVLASFPFADSELIDRALASSAAGFEVWRKTSYEERVDIMHRAANIIRENAEQTAILFLVRTHINPKKPNSSVHRSSAKHGQLKVNSAGNCPLHDPNTDHIRSVRNLKIEI